MAKKNETDPKLLSVEEKLRALYRLQLIDSQIDKIRTVRGELPLQVQDLEDEVGGLDTRIEKINSEISSLQEEISNKKNAIKDSEALIKKYEEQQKNVRNNREYDSLNKEIEFQTLEIQLSEKRIREYKAKIESKKEILGQAEEKRSDRQKDLDHKKAELDSIVAETEKDEKKLEKLSQEAAEQIEERLMYSYSRIRNRVANGMAIVAIERETAGGSFIKIPPQRILDINARKKIIVDEHSGRILIDQELAQEEADKLAELLG